MWFAFYLHHLDFYGYEKSSIKLRRQHIIGNLALLDHILQQQEHFEKPFQAWVNINDTRRFLKELKDIGWMQYLANEFRLFFYKL